MADHGIEITRIFDAPRERVWREWTEPEAFADWFGGTEFEVPLSSVSMDVRPGGSWRLTMYGPEQYEVEWRGEYHEVDEPERLVFTVTDAPGDERATVTVVLVALAEDRTEMRFEQRGGPMGPEQYEAARSGWGVFLDRISERLAN
jgi:uncharacterized protein YndB with AHSA1/START domain